MELITFLLHIDRYIPVLMNQFGIFIYAILFLILFCETGLVVTPFLPGDSILFACGAIAATGSIHVMFLLVLFLAAAILGDGINYLIGRKIGRHLLVSNHRLIKPAYIQKAQSFYDKYGGKAILLARFVPIVRTFAPFVAGIGEMHYRHFAVYNILGAVIWVPLFLTFGYCFGNLPFMKNHFTFVVLGILLFSLLPVLFEGYRTFRNHKALA